MNVLLTGAAGFIGSALLERLLSAGHLVTALDNFDAFYPRELKLNNISPVRSHPGLRFIEGDIRNIGGVDSIARRYDAIVHLAAKAGVRPSLRDPLEYHSVNLTGTHVLLEKAKEWGVRQFVFASSSSIYGVNPARPWNEDCLPFPISPYAATKAACELLGAAYSHLYGVRFISLRFFTVYGPRQRPDLAIRSFAERMLAAAPVPLFGDGAASRDYTYIDDATEGIRAALEYRGSNYEVINLGSGRGMSTLAMIRMLEQLIGTRAALDQTAAHAGDVPHTLADIRKAERLLGYRPRVSFEDGLARFVCWLKQDHQNRPAAALAVA